MKTKTTTRELSFDLLRGVAVITMVLAHSVAFFYSGNNSFINFIQTFGDTVSFSTFLFVSAAVSFIAYININDSKWKQKRLKLIKRLVALLLGYYFVAFISILHTFNFPITSAWFKNIAKTILLLEIPGYTEFIIAFVLFGLIVVSFRTTLHRIASKPLALVILATTIYLFGQIIYILNFPFPLDRYISLFAGQAGFYRFPIFQYAPVFLLGLFTGQFVNNEKNRKKRTLFYLELCIYLILVSSISLFTTKLLLCSNVTLMERWPPTLLFLSVSTLFPISVLIATNVIYKQKVNFITLLGFNAFGIYIIHLAILQLENITAKYKTQNPLMIAVLFVFLIFSSYYSIRLLNSRRNK